jgi:hypothetical protein
MDSMINYLDTRFDGITTQMNQNAENLRKELKEIATKAVDDRLGQSIMNSGSINLPHRVVPLYPSTNTVPPVMCGIYFTF